MFNLCKTLFNQFSEKDTETFKMTVIIQMGVILLLFLKLLL